MTSLVGSAVLFTSNCSDTAKATTRWPADVRCSPKMFEAAYIFLGYSWQVEKSAGVKPGLLLTPSFTAAGTAVKKAREKRLEGLEGWKGSVGKGWMLGRTEEVPKGPGHEI